ncbi:conserved hypothetical protein [Theileria orientalis strain Shintoku]|uniref:Uncharacterized protein n=1 Tax=Theileria orientalis strain Shintoku TaxID=869250 RepID=J4CD69_THEOR|nr:conserved hypothetical protein [Theileria orientalis strain Shintoku]BAM40622.1 conserved hypothetical protein [Theileria orientalis strain Shintoku]|eukprot:XP_009690923.1 conserved hypothetical protein [Theileria orientalis strain Shintoku]
MTKTRAPLCRFRRKNKNQLNDNMDPNNDNGMESEDELNVTNENENYENYTQNELNNNHNTNETSDTEEEVELEDIRNLSITMGENSQLSKLQTFVSNKLTEMIKRTSLGEKCMDSLAPLCLGGNGGECGPIDKLLGCFAEGGNGVNENELQVPEAESFRDPPTLPSGIKFVDDFNKLLDKWTEEASNTQGGQGTPGANVFKLFNLSALLKHLGDPRYVEILNKLKLNNLEKTWEQILGGNGEQAEGAHLVMHPLPELPNPKAVSNCNTKLVDLPQLEDKNVDEHAFKLYWAYTNTWLSKMFGPSFKNTSFLQPTRNWYMNMERASQLFFLRLSKTLCSA